MNGCYLMPRAEHYVAVDNVCAWPNLTMLPNGEIAAALYNRPSHGFGCGDVEWHQRYHMGVCRWRPEMLGHPLDDVPSPS